MGSNQHRSKARQVRDKARVAKSKPSCAICGSPIDYTLKWPDPMCFVLDHIIPIAAGGKDELSNKQPAHNACNSKKRARLIAPIIKRSAGLNR